MDVPEDDQDVQVQRASADLLADFQAALKPFLWKTTAAGNQRIRQRVRVRETDRLVALVLVHAFQLRSPANAGASWNLSKSSPSSSILIWTSFCPFLQMPSLRTSDRRLLRRLHTLSC